MTELKTLKQLWEERGDKTVIDVVSAQTTRFHMVGISPAAQAIGWNKAGSCEWWGVESVMWRLDTPPPKMVRYYRCWFTCWFKSGETGVYDRWFKNKEKALEYAFKYAGALSTFIKFCEDEFVDLPERGVT